MLDAKRSYTFRNGSSLLLATVCHFTNPWAKATLIATQANSQPPPPLLAEDFSRLCNQLTQLMEYTNFEK